MSPDKSEPRVYTASDIANRLFGADLDKNPEYILNSDHLQAIQLKGETIKKIAQHVDRLKVEKYELQGKITVKDDKLATLEKVLSEVSQCKLGDVVVYNPNSEDKDATFMAGLFNSINSENEKLQQKLTEAEGRILHLEEHIRKSNIVVTKEQFLGLANKATEG